IAMSVPSATAPRRPERTKSCNGSRKGPRPAPRTALPSRPRRTSRARADRCQPGFREPADRRMGNDTPVWCVYPRKFAAIRAWLPGKEGAPMSEAIELNGRRYRKPQRPTVVICVDGCDPEYLDRGIPEGVFPTIGSFARHGYLGTADAVMPTFTNPNNVSIVT